MGPARFGVPLTQAVSAPLLGAMEGRGRGRGAQFAVAAAIRLLSNAIGIAFFVFVITGGLDAYSGTYENIAGRVGIELDERGTLVLTAVGAAGLGRAGQRGAGGGLPARAAPLARGAVEGEPPPGRVRRAPGPLRRPCGHAWPPRWRSRCCSRAPSWPLLAGVAAWLALATATAARRPARVAHRRWSWRRALGLGAVAFSLVGGLGAEVAARRGLRARAAGAGGHLAALGRGRRRAARGVPAHARPAAPAARGAGGHPRAGPHRLRGPPDPRRPRRWSSWPAGRRAPWSPWWTPCWGGSTTRPGASARRRPRCRRGWRCGAVDVAMVVARRAGGAVLAGVPAWLLAWAARLAPARGPRPAGCRTAPGAGAARAAARSSAWKAR